MSTRRLQADIGLQSLLRALREAGLRIGVVELARLKHVFDLAPQLDREPSTRQLKTMLRAILVKDEPGQASFDRVFDAWFEQADAALVPIPQRRFETARSPQTDRRDMGWRALGAVILLILIVYGVFLLRSPMPKVAPIDLPVSEETGQLKIQSPKPEQSWIENLRQRKVKVRVPRIEHTPAILLWTGWFKLGLAFFSLLFAGALAWHLQRRRYLPEPEPPPQFKGAPRAFLQSLPQKNLVLLDRAQQDSLVWGIERYIAETPTRRLDVAQTVDRTARAGGLPELCFEYARFHRELWLWLDESASDTGLARLANEIEMTLSAYGLQVERAGFRGIPLQLMHADGELFAPREVDERRDFALVVILTDGRQLLRQHDADDRRMRIQALLRNLSYWPRLWFVDPAAGNSGLAALLAPHNIAHIGPRELVARLVGSAPGPQPERPDAAQTWTAACALAPSPVNEISAFRLRDALGLEVSPWRLRQASENARATPQRLQWTGPERAALLNWLTDSECVDKTGSSATTLFRALDFWENEYRAEMRRREQDQDRTPWRDTPAYQHRQMELALLQIWREPSAAITQLYKLFAGTLRETIRNQLAELAPKTFQSDQKIRLPWAWDQPSDLEKTMLLEMGFAGGALPAVNLRRPGRLWMGLGLCLGFAAGALAAAFLSPWVQPVGSPEIIHAAGRPAAARHFYEPPIDGRWPLSVAGPQGSAYQRVAPGKVEIIWALQDRPCIESLADGEAELWRCPSRGAPQRVRPGIAHSVAILAARPDNPEAQALARVLLDSGSVDQVLLGLDEAQHKIHLLGDNHHLEPYEQSIFVDIGESKGIGTGAHGAQAVIVNGTGWSELAKALEFKGLKPVGQVWNASVATLAGDINQVYLKGLDDKICQPTPYTDKNGFAFVALCAGEFMMGSPVTEPDRGTDERQHKVILSAYDIGQYEVTNGQYRKFLLEHEGADELPATGINWMQAKEFCEALGYRLPTEAEWEYAARAGSPTRWSFGDNEADLSRYAWYDKNSDFESQPVGSKEPNSWVLYDMHGNVWEWVADWYGGYPNKNQTNPQGPSEGENKVLRGGSFFDSARVLRSANRSGVRPGYAVWDDGFRCARGPRREP